MLKHSPHQESPYPLSSPQMGVYAGWAAYPQTTGYNLPSVVPFPCTVDADRLVNALQQIADTREVLHTRIVIGEDGQPRQYADMQMSVRVVRMSVGEEEAQRFMNHDFVRPFAVDGSEPLCRMAVVETPRHHYLLIDIHHLIADGLTIVHSLLGVDLPRAYQGEPLLPTAASVYQMAEEEQARCLTDDYQIAARHQQSRFRGVPFARLSGEVSDPWGATLRRSTFLDRVGIDQWCVAQGVTSNLLLMGAFALVLARWCRHDRMAFTVINHGRRGRAFADAYGMFVRSAPVMADTRGVKVIDFVRSMRGELNGTVRQAVYPFTHFCRDMGVTPDVAFGFQAAVQETVTLGECTVKGYQLAPPMTRNDLSCMVYLSDSAYELRMESSAALNTADTLQTVADAVAATVANMMAHPEALLSDIAIVSDAECRRLICLSQGEKMDYDESVSFIDLLRRQVEATPDAMAVTDATGCLTYGQLWQRVEAQAALLLSQGFHAGDIVALRAEQTKEFLIAALAAWRIGAGYEAPLLSPKGDDNSLTHAAASPSGDKRGALAYLMYTSGSTGVPNGVMVSQRAVLNLVHFIVRQWRLTAQSRIACHASVAFDASVEDLFPVLTVGGQLFLVPETIRRDPDRLYHYLIDHGITGGCMTTQWGVLMAQRYDLPLDYLCLGGERLTVNPRCSGRVYNTYGPTEMTVDATYYELERGRLYDTIPIGRPLPNLAAYVVDAEGHLLPQGVTGELWLAGPQMAEGYWNDDALTAQRFTTCRFSRERVYHTGDLVRWNADGLLEYMGRTDRQVKLRGYRIEPGQVEQAIMRVGGVQQAVVMVRQIAGQDHLCAYYSAGRVITPNEMTLSLEDLLPPYMIPTAYQQMDVLPLTAHDKVDTEQLPDIDICAATKEYVAPANDLERRWCGIFAQVLGVDRVGVTDDFFDLGGTSLTAVHLLSAAAEQGLLLTYEQIFEHPTVQGIVGQEARGKKQEARGKKQEARGMFWGVGQEDGFSIASVISSPSKLEEVPGGRGRVSIADAASRVSTVGQGILQVHSSEFKVQCSMYLTGATGFLGIHVLRELLELGFHVTCMVRATDDDHALARLLDTWQWYFPDTPIDAFGSASISTPLQSSKFKVQSSKMKAIAADITDPSLVSMPLPREGTGEGVLIHCAADVRQFAAGDQLYRVNVEGTRHVIALCQRLHISLVHISTISLGHHVPYPSSLSLHPSHIPPAPCPLPPAPKNTPYLRTKAEAERLVADAVTHEGLEALILRVGNLTARRSDGKFQRNADENAFYLIVDALKSLGCYPSAFGDMPIDLSPVDDTARRVVEMLFSDSDQLVADVSCSESQTLGSLASLYGLEPVSLTEMEQRMKTARLHDRQRLMLSWWLASAL